MKIRWMANIPIVAVVLSGCVIQPRHHHDNDAHADTYGDPNERAAHRGGNLRLRGQIYFESGKSDILAGSEGTLRELKRFMDEKKQVTLLRIEGHTDNVGSAGFNKQLSGDRAKAVKTWLVDRGIDSSRLVAVGFGDTMPNEDNATAEGRAKNRRTEYVVIAVDGRLVRGETREVR